MKEKSPAYQRYPKDYLSDLKVQIMSLEQEGAYNRLMDMYWLEGFLPNNDEQLAMACKNCSMEVIRVVKLCFEVSDNDPSKLVHPRLDKEREKQAIWRQKSSEGGKKSAEARAKKFKTKSKSPKPKDPPIDLTNFLQKECEAFSDQFDKQLIKDFIRYWGEKDPKGKKQRWQMEKTWETGRRLDTWYKNSIKFNKNNNIQQQTKPVYQGSILDKINKQNERE